MTLALRPYQDADIRSVRVLLRQHRSVLYVLPTGGGKCLGRGERVLMFDGSTRAVENIVVGDRLMGPDSRPRTVQALGRGYGPMVTVRPNKGRAWRCNDEHILTLVRTREKANPQYPSQRLADEIVDVSVKEWRTWSKWRKHVFKLFRAGVIFEPLAKPVPIDPYFLGVLLGDGCLLRNTVSVTTMDPEIALECVKQAAEWGLKLREETSGGTRCPTYHITRDRGGRAAPHLLAEAVKRLGIALKSGEKFIPEAYKRASLQERRELLAGLIDTDGALARTGFDYLSKSRLLADDVAFVARSLGLAAYVSPKAIPEGVYWRVSISGETDAIPVRIPRKKAPERRQKKNVRRTGFEIVDDGEDEFFGFTLDGDGRFLLDDFTVTHNTVFAGFWGQALIKNGHSVLCLVHRKEILEQFAATMRGAGLELELGLISPDHSPTPWAPMQVASIFSLVKRRPGIKPAVIFVDEAHHVRASTWDKVLARYPAAKIIGMTATPRRLDGLGLGRHFEVMHTGPSIRELVAQQYLAPLRTLSVPAGFNDVRISKGNDFVRSELAKQVNERTVARGASAYVKHALGKRALFFGLNVKHSEMVAAELRSYGVKAAHVDAQTPKYARNRLFEEFRDGRLDVVCNVDLVSEGFDMPDCECVIDGQPTMSLARYKQKAGRAMRPYPDDPTREKLFIDTANNYRLHGEPGDPHDWSLEDEIDENAQRNVVKKPQGAALRTCKQCMTVFRPPERHCPACGTEYPPHLIVIEEEVELVDVTGKRPPKAPARPKKTRKETKAAIAQAHALRGAGDQRGAWEILSLFGQEAGYHARWAHRMADIVRIEPRERQ